MQFPGAVTKANMLRIYYASSAMVYLVLFSLELQEVGPWKDRVEVRDIFLWNEGCFSYLLMSEYLSLVKTELQFTVSERAPSTWTTLLNWQNKSEIQ